MFRSSTSSYHVSHRIGAVQWAPLVLQLCHKFSFSYWAVVVSMRAGTLSPVMSAIWALLLLLPYPDVWRMYPDILLLPSGKLMPLVR